MTDLSQKIKHAYIAMFGNRLTLAGLTFCLAATVVYFNSKDDDYSFRAVGAFSSSAGILLLCATRFGAQTLRYYKRTSRHILKNNGFDERYLRTALYTENPFSRYCIGQGAYLAAKEAGHLEAFETARQRHSGTIIPHF